MDWMEFLTEETVVFKMMVMGNEAPRTSRLLPDGWRITRNPIDMKLMRVHHIMEAGLLKGVQRGFMKRGWVETLFVKIR